MPHIIEGDRKVITLLRHNDNVQSEWMGPNYGLFTNLFFSNINSIVVGDVRFVVHETTENRWWKRCSGHFHYYGF